MIIVKMIMITKMFVMVITMAVSVDDGGGDGGYKIRVVSKFNFHNSCSFQTPYLKKMSPYQCMISKYIKDGSKTIHEFYFTI